MMKFDFKNKKGWWDNMTPKELTQKTVKDIIKRRKKAENEIKAYQSDQTAKKMRNWSVRVGGSRW
ncbi:hypothetical protein [Clostridium beijerinckii]|uniref:Uncharacterized protein n=3 Tax=Clostridium TaxID=1485 RepID=A0A7X9SSU4_CLOBE|nr:hypothetical protein [Clostridium beijerinckii]NMF07425.1 hypothetical protein [Clostridium beijerinckii]